MKIKLLRVAWLSVVIVITALSTYWLLLSHHAGDVVAGEIDNGKEVHLLGRIEQVYGSNYLLKDPSGTVWVSTPTAPRTSGRWAWVLGEVKTLRGQRYVAELRRLSTF